MKRLMIILTVMFVLSVSAFAQMGTGQGGGMMGGNWGRGMGYGWGFGIIIAICHFRYRLYDETKVTGGDHYELLFH